MTGNEKSFLANRALDAHEWRGVEELSNALHEFEPIRKRGVLDRVVIERLLCLGLAEKGRGPELTRRPGVSHPSAAPVFLSR